MDLRTNLEIFLTEMKYCNEVEKFNYIKNLYKANDSRLYIQNFNELDKYEIHEKDFGNINFLIEIIIDDAYQINEIKSVEKIKEKEIEHCKNFINEVKKSFINFIDKYGDCLENNTDYRDKSIGFSYFYRLLKLLYIRGTEMKNSYLEEFRQEVLIMYENLEEILHLYTFMDLSCHYYNDWIIYAYESFNNDFDETDSKDFVSKNFSKKCKLFKKIIDENKNDLNYMFLKYGIYLEEIYKSITNDKTDISKVFKNENCLLLLHDIKRFIDIKHSYLIDNGLIEFWLNRILDEVYAEFKKPKMKQVLVTEFVREKEKHNFTFWRQTRC
jgi:hypothetical protein